MVEEQLEVNRMQHSQLITIEDKTTPGTLTPQEYFNGVWAVNYQVMFHYGRSPWVNQGLAPPCHLMFLPKDTPPPLGAWNIILLDTADQAGALGWHDDGSNNIPYAEVFVKTSREDGATWTSVLSHEAIEMACDPFVDPKKVRTVTHNGYVYIVEACDAVQGCDYDVGDPENRKVGVTVSDFCLPSWWKLGLSGPSSKMSFRSSVASPFELAQQGYISRAPEGTPDNWEQIFGEMRTEHPAWASRLPRVHNA